jgi:hypothetical protein
VILETYLTVVVFLGAFVVTAFPLFYRRSPWRETEVGRALMGAWVALALLFDSELIIEAWPFPGHEYLTAAIVTLLVGALTAQFVAMIRLQRQGRHADPGQF